MTAPFQLDRSVPFVDAVFQIIEGTASQRKAIDILRAAEQAHQIKLILPQQVDIPQAADNDYELFVGTNFFDFLSQTNLVLGSYDYDDMTVLLPNNTQWMATFRAWGALLAEWSNSTRWLGGGNWHYMYFYGGPTDQLIEKYNIWSETVLQVIQSKCLENS